MEIESLIKCFPKNKSPGLNSFIVKFYPNSQEEATLMFHNLFKTMDREAKPPCSLHEANTILLSKPERYITKRTVDYNA